MSQANTAVKMLCPYCNKEAEYLPSEQFYGMDYKTNVYFCQPCDARVGTHKNSSRPLGTMANSHLRVYRQKCHALIDPYWKTGKHTRSEVYRRMAKAMNLTSEEAHIGMFNMEQCKQLIKFFSKQ